MKTKLFLFICLLFSTITYAQNTDSRYYEMRIYYCHPHRLDALIQRFTNHTTKIFEKHGMTNIGYWIPVGNDSTLYYILSYPNKEARDASWKAFGSDPEWQDVAKKSEESGKIVAKVVSIFMKTTDFSPAVKESIKMPNRTFELRTYIAMPDKMSDVLARFRNHSMKLLAKHDMENVMYFTTIEKDASVQPKLIYILGHKSEETGKKSWDAFRADPAWIKVKEDSEKNGKIVEKAEGMYMIPTAFSVVR